MAALETKLSVAPTPEPSPRSLRPSSPRPPAHPSLLDRWIPGGLTRLTVFTSDQYARSPVKAAPSKWSSPEYLLHIAGTAFLAWQWTSIALRISKPTHPNFEEYGQYLSSGWMGPRFDNTDSQYRQFRAGAIPLAGLACLYLVAARLHASYNAHRPRLHARLDFLVPVSLLLNVLLHGTSSLKVFAILALNYALARSLAGTRAYVVLVWTVNIGFLFLNELNSGYKYATLYEGLQWLDSWNGLLPRWHVLFNFSMLRIVSFGLDYHASLRPNHEPRTSSPRSHDYTPAAFIAYALYPPLYIAGPIMLFDEFYAQLKEPPKITRKDIFGYSARFVVCVLTMEWILHNIFVVAIKNTHAWQGLSPAELSMVGYWNLVTVWLKLLIPWRFFRLWAMADGVDDRRT